MVVSGSNEQFETPPVGLQPAVCINVFDIGFHKGLNDKIMHKCVLLWELGEKKTDGNRFLVTKIYTASLGEKASLRKDLASWRTRDFTEDELKSFDLDNIITKNCQLNLVATSKNGSTYVNVDSVIPASKSAAPLVPETGRDFIPEWVKKMQTEALPPPKAPEPGKAPAQSDHFDDDIPF
jgi:hypothetical protein